MVGTSRKKGGFLEPVQKTPAFKYTESQERKLWTEAIYPYAPYFFNLFREIPWDEYSFTGFNNLYTMKCNPIPYVIMGGSACEIYEREYKKNPNYKLNLHKYVDPTGDIDAFISPPYITPSPGKRVYTKYFFGNTFNLSPHGDHFSSWLLQQITNFFEKLSYNFESWFPNAIEFDFEKGDESKGADISSSVGPFEIYRTKIMDADGPRLKIQVGLALEFKEANITIHDHLLEFLLLDDPVLAPEIESEMETISAMSTSLGLYVSPVEYEIISNISALEDRYKLKSTNYSYKYYNHFYRSIYLIQLLEYIVNNQIISITQKEYYDLADTYLRSAKYIFEKGDTQDVKLLLNTFPYSLSSNPQFVQYSLYYVKLMEKLKPTERTPFSFLNTNPTPKTSLKRKTQNINCMNTTNNRSNTKRVKTRRQKKIT